MLKVVLDTNVLVSAFLKKGSAPAAILTLAEEGDIYLCVSRAVMEEYEGVLQRDKFRPFGQRAVEYLRKARKRFIWVAPAERITAAKDDPEDNKFLECAVAARADYLVSGNVRHFPPREYRGTRIVTPREFIAVAARTMFTRGKGG
jgi:putative PIN family toxin of toxin-antitoxin system